MRTALVPLLLLVATPALAAPKPATQSEIDALKPTAGPAKVTVGDNIASIALPKDYAFFGPKDARFIIERLWGNPSAAGVLGLIVPKPKDDGKDDTEDGDDTDVGIVITYEDEGHINDDDAAKMNFDDLLKQMQASDPEENAERAKAGFPAIQLLGWAEPPHYDFAAKKLYWATRLKFGDGPKDTLNYNVRILGRTGTLVMNTVGDVGQLAAAATAAKEILQVTEFNQGKRYSDYLPSADKAAAVGIGGLIAGKVLLKVGFFAGLLKVLAGFAKPILVALGAVTAKVAQLFGRKKKDDTQA